MLLTRIATAQQLPKPHGMLPFKVVPVEAAAKATLHLQVNITNGQASSHKDQLKNLPAGADLVLLPTTPQARSGELSV